MKRFVHIGGDRLLDADAIIFAVDRASALASRDTRHAIDTAIGRGRIHSLSSDAQRSYIVAETGGELTVYASPVSAETLAARSAVPLREMLAP